MKVRITPLKILILLSALLLWFNFPMYASADNICSSDSQVMFRLYSATNAHIEKVLPIKNYNTDVCYNSVFGVDYNISNQTQCTGSNTLLNLNSLTNAHAEDKTLSNYNETLCYGDLNCRLTTLACDLNESFTASLSSQTNAHISSLPVYPYNLCCSSNFALTNQNQTNQTDIFPIITVHSPIPGTYNTTSLLLNVSAINASSIRYSINSGINTTYLSPLNLSFPEGNSILSVFATSVTGNESNTNIALTINTSISPPGNQTNDTTAPVISNITTTPTLPLTTNNSNITFNASFVSNEFPINVYFLLLNSTNTTIFTTQTFPVNSPADLPLSFTLPANLADNLYSLYINASDLSNNTSQSLVGQITINSTFNQPPGNQTNQTDIFPIITIHSPLPGFYNTTSLLLNVSAINASSIRYSVNSGLNITYTSPIFIALPEGNSVLSVFAISATGNESNTNIALTINTTSGGGGGGGNGGGGGGNGGGGGGGSSNNRNRIYLNNAPEEEPQTNNLALSEYMDQNQPISLGKKKAQVRFDMTLVWIVASLLILLILLLLILILLAKRRDD